MAPAERVPRRGLLPLRARRGAGHAGAGTAAHGRAGKEDDGISPEEHEQGIHRHPHLARSRDRRPGPRSVRVGEESR